MIQTYCSPRPQGHWHIFLSVLTLADRRNLATPVLRNHGTNSLWLPVPMACVARSETLTLWSSNMGKCSMAMENPPFIDEFPIQTSMILPCIGSFPARHIESLDGNSSGFQKPFSPILKNLPRHGNIRLHRRTARTAHDQRLHPASRGRSL